MTDRKLCAAAAAARENAYAPYSKFKVGAALLCADGAVYTGCNVENAAFSATVCAERVAIFKAVGDGRRDFVKIAIVGGGEPCPPCGACRQVMAEFCGGEFEILLPHGEKTDRYTLSELLPHSFEL